MVIGQSVNLVSTLCPLSICQSNTLLLIPATSMYHRVYRVDLSNGIPFSGSTLPMLYILSQ